jgi:ribosomal protein S18 acetylase RimI-like enzyme
MNTDKIDSAVIVKMQMDDISFVLEILVENSLETWNYNDFLSEIQRLDSLALVGKIKNKVIGFCVARLIITNDTLVVIDKTKSFNKSNCRSILGDPTDFKSKKSSREGNFEAECEIYNIAVKKEFQNQGIGKCILEKIVFLIKRHNVQSIWLEVRSSNRKAINFYRNNNFRQVYERKNFYSNPLEDAIVMNLNLQ